MAELLGCGLVRAALGMQSMTEPELKALMEQCTEAVTAAADATEADAQERLGNVAAALLLRLMLDCIPLCSQLRAYPYAYTLLPLYYISCLLYTSPSPRDATLSRMPSSA